MIESIVAVALVVLVVFGPLALSVVRERRAERALALQAEIQYAVDRRLGGASYLKVHAESPTLWRPGRVVLAAPRTAESLVDTVAPTALALTPGGYELVIALGPGPEEAPGKAAHLRRAA
jgi:hypothetical protein